MNDRGLGIFQTHKTENEDKSSQITTSKGNCKTKRREKTKKGLAMLYRPQTQELNSVSS